MENCHITEELNKQELKKIRDTFYSLCILQYNTAEPKKKIYLYAWF